MYVCKIIYDQNLLKKTYPWVKISCSKCKAMCLRCTMHIDMATVTYWEVSHLWEREFHSDDFITLYQRIISECCGDNRLSLPADSTAHYLLSFNNEKETLIHWKGLEACHQKLFKRDWRADIHRQTTIWVVGCELDQTIWSLAPCCDPHYCFDPSYVLYM